MNTTKVFINNDIDIVNAGQSCCSEDELHTEIVTIQDEAASKEKKAAELAVRRNEIRKLLQRHSVSMSSLQVLSNTEIRHEENCRAIPEGNEDEDEDEDDNDEGNDNDNDNEDDSIEKITTSLSESSLAPTENDDSDSNSDSESNSDIENGERQIEPKRRRRHVFHRVKRFVVGRKSVRC